MRWLVDQDRSYRVISDTTVPNYGRLGGTLRVILVERAGSENPERMSVAGDLGGARWL